MPTADRIDVLPSLTVGVLWPITAQRKTRVLDGATASHPICSGKGYIAGTVTHDGGVASRPVRLYDRATGALVAKTQSAADGSYRFDNLSTERTFLVVATDADVNEFNAACADLIEATV